MPTENHNPFRNTLWLSLGEVVAKTLNFLAIVYLARTLGVASYGELEFAITILAYFALLADSGLEVWSTRETARGSDVAQLAANTTALRLLFSVIAFGTMMLLLPIFPDYPHLQPVLLLLGATLIVQSINLKWVFLGQEKMRLLAFGVVMGQIFFAGAIVVFVKSPEQLIWAALIWLCSEIVSAVYFAGLFFAVQHRGLPRPRWQQMQDVIKPSMTIGIMQALGIMNYNFDSLLLGFMSGVEPVGWYRAGYKPITAAISIPLTYFAGLLPALTRSSSHSRELFLALINRSFRLTVIFAIPIGFGGVFIARPVVQLLYGEGYSQSILVMQILSWSAVIVLIRATLRHGLLAVGRQDLALRSAAVAVSFNVILNLLLIPKFGMVGAAFTTVFSDLIWLILISFDFAQIITPIDWLSFMVRPLLAGVGMVGAFLLTKELFWPFQLTLAGIFYFAILVLLGEPEVRSWIHQVRLKITASR